MLLSVNDLSAECIHATKCKVPVTIFLLLSVTLQNLHHVFSYPLLCSAAVHGVTWILDLLAASTIVGDHVRILFTRLLNCSLLRF